VLSSLLLEIASACNPLKHLVNGVRYFAIRSDFYAGLSLYLYS
jgi:hypothetical protein